MVSKILATRDYDLYYQDIVKMAAHICQAPISVVSLIDGDTQFLKASHGIELKEIPGNASICIHTIGQEDGVMIVDNLATDQRFKNSPFVTGEPFAKFYAGFCLTTEEGKNIGTVCIVDQKPRQLSTHQIEALKLMTRYTNALILLSQKNEILKQTNEELQKIYQSLESFSYSIAHDIKGPLRLINSYASLLHKKVSPKLDENELTLLSFIQESSTNLFQYTENLLKLTMAATLDTESTKEINLNQLILNIRDIHHRNTKVDIQVNCSDFKIITNETALTQVLQNLISNGVRYSNPEIPNPKVTIQCEEEACNYRFAISDNGIGIKPDRMAQLFNLFEKNPLNSHSSGIGLNIVKRLIEKLNGQIDVRSEEGSGTTVEFTIAKKVDHQGC